MDINTTSAHGIMTSPWNNVTATDVQQNYEEYDIAMGINRYFPPFLIVFGTIFNILVVIIMRNKRFSSVSTSYYMSFTAISDTLSILGVFPAHFLYLNFPDTIVRTSSSHVMCKFFMFIGWTGSDIGIIFTAAMTAERAVAVSFPLKAASLCTVSRAKKIIAMLTVFVGLKDCHFLIYSDLVPPTTREQLCRTNLENPAYAYFYENIWPWIHTVFVITAFIIIMTSNIIIVYHVRKASKKKRLTRESSEVYTVSKTGSRRAPRGAYAKGTQLTVMLLAESFAMVFLTFPFCFHQAFVPHISGLFQDAEGQAEGLLVFSVVFYLLYTNKCVNFCLYCVSGARFRKCLVELVCCRKRKNREMFNGSATRHLSTMNSRDKLVNDSTLSVSSQPSKV